MAPSFRTRTSARRCREVDLKVESLEPRLALATGLLSTLVSIVRHDQSHHLLAPGATAEIAEGQEMSASVRLTRRPGSPIVVSFQSLAPLEVAATPQTLRFTRANWNQPQPVTLRSLQDDVRDGDWIVPVRMTTAVANRPNSRATQALWVESLDAGLASPATPPTGTYRGSLLGGNNRGSVVGSYDSLTRQGTATFTLTMPSVTGIRGRIVSVSYTVDPATARVQVDRVEGIKAAKFRLDATYREDGVDRGLFGTVTILQPRLGQAATAMMTAAALPAAVRDLAVTPTGTGSLRLSWSPPVFGASGYTVTMNDGTATTSFTTSSTSIPFTGLVATGSSYTFTVTATNVAGR